MTQMILCSHPLEGPVLKLMTLRLLKYVILIFESIMLICPFSYYATWLQEEKVHL